MAAALTLVGSTVVAGGTAAAASGLAVPSQYPTIQAALNAATAGDTVTVAPGVYQGNLDFHGKDVRLASTAGAAATVINGTGGSTVSIGPDASITGFTISGGTATFGAGMLVNGTGTVIAKNLFRANTSPGGGFGAAIGGNSASPTIVQNVFTENGCDAQFVSGVVSFVNSSSPLIANNVFHDNPCRAVNLTLPAGTAPVVVNNTMVRNSVGVRVDGRIPSTNYVFRNNIVASNGTGLEVDFGNGPTWDHNLVYANTVDYSGIADQSGVSGNLAVDPRFVGAGSNDFHLSPTSPAIGAGTSSDAPSTDFDGVTRPTLHPAIGAFEATPTTPHTTFNCTIRAANGKYVSVGRRTGGRLDGALRAVAATVGPRERFTCVATGSNEWALRSRANGAFVDAGLASPKFLAGTLRARSTTIGSTGTFSIEPGTGCGGCSRLRFTSNHLFVSAELGYTGPFAGLLRARASNPGPWEAYTIASDAG